MNKLFGCISVLSVCAWGQAVSPTMNPLPTRQFGQPSLQVPLTQASPNLVEGRELSNPGGIALDTSVSPPILYIADTGNNRVLAYKNSASITKGQFADLVIGQNDFVSTLTQGGASSSLTTGLNTPVGLAVDSKGNLWVADAGNNRILRFPTPFNNSGGAVPNPDIVIGQKSYASGTSPNEGGGSICSAKTLAFSQYGSVYIAGLAVDSGGNLWTTDPVNNRVLMYPAGSLVKGAAEVAATVVLGQTSFTTNALPGGVTQLTKSSTVQPAGLAFDSAGNLYVVDSYSRVLYFPAPISTGQSAARVLGIPQAQTTAIVYPTQYTLGYPNASGNLLSPNGVFTFGNHLYVADSPANRIVEYDVPANWPAETTTAPSPPIMAVLGQINYTTATANQGLAQPNSSTLTNPYTGTFDGSGNMWVADAGNNRVLAFKVNVTGGYNSASQLVGQLDYIYRAPNLIEGKEVFLAGLTGSASAMVVDKNSTPPHLYIADPGNNRVLCFNNAYTVGGGTSLTFADLVIGQPDKFTSEINYPGGQAGSPTQTGLYSPVGLAVDNNGNLYVADAGNGRVVRFPAPFNQPAGQQPTANLVLGQPDFVTLIQNASASFMHTPFGLALFAGSDANATPLAGGLAVSDPIFNRVLVFKKGAGGDFTNGQAAYLVLGQNSATSTSAGNGLAAFNKPLGIAADTSDRLYVADYANGRVLAFTQVPESLSNGPTSTLQYTGLNAPEGVAINTTTTELWVTNTNSNQLLRYPQFTTCQLSVTGGCQPTSVLTTNASPLGIATDGSGNIIAGDVANRITFYFPQLFYKSAASYANQQPLVPGMLAAVGRFGLPMTIGAGAAATNPWPTTLGGVTMTVTSTNGTQTAPLFRTDSGYGAIFFQVPYEVPTSGTANFTVTQNNNGAIIGVGTFQLGKTNPGFFSANSQGFGPVAALNKDNTVNSPTNPAARGDYVQLFLTGLGQVQNPPADGYAPAASNIVSTPALPTVTIQGATATVLYSGPGAFAGGWQINVTIPQTAVPTAPNWVIVQYLDGVSNWWGTTSSDGISPGADQKLGTSNLTTIYVK